MLEVHFGAMQSIVVGAVEPNARAALTVDWGVAPVTAGIIGSGCERIERNRGHPVLVAPMISLGRGLWAWLGFREEWDFDQEINGKKRLLFRTAGVTVYFGYRNMIDKPQIFRAEWAGWARWNGASFSHQAGEAGHPHWQFDAVDSLMPEGVAERAALALEVLRKEEEAATPTAFSPTISAEDVIDTVMSRRLDRLHFASAASWWRSPPNGSHAHAPQSAAEIETWLTACLAYLTDEMARL